MRSCHSSSLPAKRNTEFPAAMPNRFTPCVLVVDHSGLGAHLRLLLFAVNAFRVFAWILQNCLVKHSLRGREQHRCHIVDKRGHKELQKVDGNNFELILILALTPNSHAMSNRCVAPLPTYIDVLMELTKPGRLGGTDISSARSARQF